MTPRLALRGKLVAASAVLFVLVGSLNALPPLVGIGGFVVVVILAAYIAFYPTAVLLRRKKIELSWWVPPGDQPGGALAAARPFLLHVAFRNHGGRRLRILGTQILASSGLEIEGRPSATVAAGTQVEITTKVRPHIAGYQLFHGAALTLGDPLGLFDVEAYFPNPISVKVFPRSLSTRHHGTRPTTHALPEAAGLHQVRRRGHAGELRELREHMHGDSFKFIAWKATARRRRLMVRDIDSEIVATQVMLVDVGASMRVGALGTTALDWAIEAAAAMTRAAAVAGDRVGLCTFDTRRVVDLAPAAGHSHWLALVDRLLDARSIVDEDLTDVTAGELVAQVAGYLAHHEALDIRVRNPPALDDPRWNTIQAGPTGQLYDLAVCTRFVQKLLDDLRTDRRRISVPRWWWSRAGGGEEPDADPQLLPLRLFCRMRGIELPYRTLTDLGARSRGLVDAIDHVLTSARPDLLVIISDLAGLGEDTMALTRALGRARRSSGRITALVPDPAAFLPPALSTPGQKVRRLLIHDHREATQSARLTLKRAGVRIVDVTPTTLGGSPGTGAPRAGTPPARRLVA